MGTAAERRARQDCNKAVLQWQGHRGNSTSAITRHMIDTPYLPSDVSLHWTKDVPEKWPQKDSQGELLYWLVKGGPRTVHFREHDGWHMVYGPGEKESDDGNPWETGEPFTLKVWTKRKSCLERNSTGIETRMQSEPGATLLYFKLLNGLKQTLSRED